jgi:hypothetical protein
LDSFSPQLIDVPNIKKKRQKTEQNLDVKNDNLQRALQRINMGDSIHSASKNCNIPYATLYKKYKAGSDVYSRKGPKTVLSEQHELELVDIIELCVKRGFHPSARQVIDYATSILNRFYSSDHVERHSPLSRKWVSLFFERHKKFGLKLITMRPISAVIVVHRSLESLS